MHGAPPLTHHHWYCPFPSLTIRKRTCSTLAVHLERAQKAQLQYTCSARCIEARAAMKRTSIQKTWDFSVKRTCSTRFNYANELCSALEARAALKYTCSALAVHFEAHLQYTCSALAVHLKRAWSTLEAHLEYT